MKYVKAKVRQAAKSDLPAIFRVEKRSYTPQLQASHKVLEYRMDTFGIWVAEVKGIVRGFSTCVPAKISWPKPNIREIITNRKPMYRPWFVKFSKSKNFNTLLVTSTAVESAFQGQGIGTALIKFSLKLAKRHRLKYRASALRCEYKRYFDKTGCSITDYISEVKKGKIRDRFLGPYLKLGFILSSPLPKYESYKGSCHYNIFAYKKI